jgi:ABC-type branched-subunit amino acid transport system substrate-binding protein
VSGDTAANNGLTPANGGVPTTAATQGGTAAGTPMFGTLPVPCGPNTTGQPLTATGQGVTADEIQVTTISDPGGIIPGLDQGIFDSMNAFAKWCNGYGGINGRKLVVNTRDAAILHYKEQVDAACASDFAMVGGLGVLDSTGAQDMLNCKLVNVPGAADSPEVADGDRVYQPLPNPIETFATGAAQWVTQTFPDAKTGAALYTKQDITQKQSEKIVEGYGTFGVNFPYIQSSNLNETNWGPIVVGMKNAGAKFMSLTSTYQEGVNLQKEMAAQNWHPEVTQLETNFYDSAYPASAKAAGADITNTYVRLTVWPFEEADQNPATKQYLEALKAAVPDAVPAELGVQAWSAGLLFATAAKNAGANLTRDSLIAELKKIHDWNGGGLHGHADPGDNKPATCVVMMQVTDDGFKRAYPLADKDTDVYNNADTKGMFCPKPGFVILKGDYGKGLKETGN